MTKTPTMSFLSLFHCPCVCLVFCDILLCFTETLAVRTVDNYSDRQCDPVLRHLCPLCAQALSVFINLQIVLTDYAKRY